jgi:cullin-associated NEDD8-dissociated protein 1
MAPSQHSAAHIQSLLPKLHDADSDFRYMALNDLYDILANGPSNLLSSDSQLSLRTMEEINRSLSDANGEVQNLAVKW